MERYSMKKNRKDIRKGIDKLMIVENWDMNCYFYPRSLEWYKLNIENKYNSKLIQNKKTKNLYIFGISNGNTYIHTSRIQYICIVKKNNE